MRQRSGDRPLRRVRPALPVQARALVAAPHLPTGVARIRQDHRHRTQIPRRSAAVPIPLRIRGRRTRHTTLVQLPRDARHTAPGQTLGEHPPHMPRRHRVRIQPLPPTPPHGVRPIRMRSRIHQPIPIRRPTTQKPALLDRLHRIAAMVRCRDRTTSRYDCAASTCINTECLGSSSRTGPPASGSHTSIPRRANKPATCSNWRSVNARSNSPTTTASNDRSAAHARSSSAAACGRRSHATRRDSRHRRTRR